MNTKQTNLFILLLFLAGISTAVGAPKEELRRVLDKRVQEDGLEQMAWFGGRSNRARLCRNFRVFSCKKLFKNARNCFIRK